MYIVEGNIGVGKSTFISLINQRDSRIDVVPEPQNQWSKPIGGQSLLDNFYRDPARWAYTIETLAMMCRARDHMKEQNQSNLNRILERSLYSGHFVFAHNDFASGYLGELEWELYLHWVALIMQHCMPPLGFIYLRAEPEVCFERITKRQRESESGITLDYIKTIHTWHDRFLLKKTDLPASLHHVPVLVLDCNAEFSTDHQVLEQHYQAVQQFFAQTQVDAGSHQLLRHTNSCR